VISINRSFYSIDHIIYFYILLVFNFFTPEDHNAPGKKDGHKVPGTEDGRDAPGTNPNTTVKKGEAMHERCSMISVLLPIVLLLFVSRHLLTC